MGTETGTEQAEVLEGLDLRPPTPSTATTSPTPPTWTPPPLEALAVARDLSSWDCPSVDQVLWVGKGAVGRVGLWAGDAA